MNATSSRAHTVITITFNQISKNEMGQETKKTSVINLVDLAGEFRGHMAKVNDLWLWPTSSKTTNNQNQWTEW